tara:strand:- start:325 stop:1068 length:744 start_codon:yes stop_codon:yes gene_type:complete
VKFSLDENLIIVGVGPGDPSLMTLAAVKAIQAATVIAYPIAKAGNVSNAAKIAADLITSEKKKLPLIFPMVSDVELRKKAWREAGHALASQVNNGETVVFLCLGDSSLFSTASYLVLDIKNNHPECRIRIIPGITSFSAAAAAANFPLALQQDQLLIIPTPEDSTTLEKLLIEACLLRRVVVLLKLGKRWLWVRPLLERMNLLEDSLFAENVGFEEEKIISSIEIPAKATPYFSLLLIRQRWPDDMP